MTTLVNYANTPISSDMLSLSIDENILRQATILLNNFPISSRPGKSRKRRQLVLLALYEAYNQNGTPVCSFELGNKLQLNSNDVKQAFSKFYGQVTNNSGYVSPLSMISNQAKILACSPGLTQDIVDYSTQLLERKPQLLDVKKPQLMAAALIMYYLFITKYLADLNNDTSTFIADQLKVCPNNLLTLVKNVREQDNL